jgi:hypothetical protein
VWFDDTGILAALRQAPLEASAADLVAHVSVAAERGGPQRDDRALLILRALT